MMHFLTRLKSIVCVCVCVCNYISYILQSVTLRSNSQLYLNQTEAGSPVKDACEFSDEKLSYLGRSLGSNCTSGKILENEHCVGKSFLSRLLCNNIDLYHNHKGSRCVQRGCV